MSATQKNIALMRPKLPLHEAIAPYWQQIDGNRWYSNFGPLAQKLEERFGAVFGYDKECVVTLGNGTAGLTNIMRAKNLPKGSYCLMPSWTFIATPASAISAGLVPYFIDVDADTWALSPQTVRAHLRELGSKVSAVIVVAPFGAPLDTAAWDKLSEETGVTVIIDAAAGYDAFSTVASSRPGKSPVMISLHATKALGIGEGGIVVSSDSELVMGVQKMSNFGFCGSRIVSIPGTNGKMSEYHAAVGLAALDGWQEKRARFDQLRKYYVEAFADEGIVVRAPSLYGPWLNSTLSVQFENEVADLVISMLNKAGVESRGWWGKGCHSHPAYANYPSAELPVTAKLSRSMTALPFWLDMTQDDVRFVVATLGNALKAAGGMEKQKAYA